MTALEMAVQEYQKLVRTKTGKTGPTLKAKMPKPIVEYQCEGIAPFRGEDYLSFKGYQTITRKDAETGQMVAFKEEKRFNLDKGKARAILAHLEEVMAIAEVEATE